MDILFASREEFIAGMNRIAICCQMLNGRVQVIAFCLMDNHVHFLLYAIKEDCEIFMANYRKLSEMWISKHRENNTLERNWEIDFWQIKNKETLEETIAYIHRNPVAAGMKVTPSGYMWSSASLYFNQNSALRESSQPVSSFSLRKIRELTFTKTTLPNDWLVLPNGMILPECYTNYKLGEKYFDTAREYMYYANKKVEDDINNSQYVQNFSLPDTEVLNILGNFSKKLFAQEDIFLLGIEQRLQLCKVARKSIGSNIKQLSRVLHLKREDLELILK